MDYNKNMLLDTGATSLKKIALNEEAKKYVLENEVLYSLLKKAADRYIGGENLDEVLLTIAKLNKRGYAVTTDYMGESIHTEIEANLAKDEFITLIRAIKGYGLQSSISLDLSHIGLLVSEDLVKQNLILISEEARNANLEVIISMEGIERTDQVLNIYKEASKTQDNLGITLQAYLHRTIDDFKEVMNCKGSIRMVKGAFDVPENIAIARGNILNDMYLSYVEQLLERNHFCSIASHDHYIFQEAIQLIEKYKATNYTLERLLGIENNEFDLYKEEKYNCRMYVVYGKEWFLYLCNRWAEYPLNLFRGLEDMITVKPR